MAVSTGKIIKVREKFIMEQQTMKIQDLTLIALMAALTCILGPMSITLPFTPVPISFTNLVIYFAVMVIGMKRWNDQLSCIPSDRSSRTSSIFRI